MKSLLVVAHGSRRAGSNDEVRQLTEQLRESVGEAFSDVACAFLELAEPLVPEGIRRAAEKGATEILVLPYFLSAGRHVVKDIPEQVAVGQREHPEVRIRTTPYLGAAPAMVELLRSLTDPS